MAAVGHISRATVIRVLPYGALVRLDDGCLGLVHISEVDARFVRDVADYLEPEDRIVVKVLACKDDGKYEFSIKRVGAAAAELAEEPLADDFTPAGPASRQTCGAPRIPDAVSSETWLAFDDKMRCFNADSTERLSDFRRHQDPKLSKHRR